MTCREGRLRVLFAGALLCLSLGVAQAQKQGGAGAVVAEELLLEEAISRKAVEKTDAPAVPPVQPSSLEAVAASAASRTEVPVTPVAATNAKSADIPWDSLLADPASAAKSTASTAAPPATSPVQDTVEALAAQALTATVAVQGVAAQEPAKAAAVESPVIPVVAAPVIPVSEPPAVPGAQPPEAVPEAVPVAAGTAPVVPETAPPAVVPEVQPPAVPEVPAVPEKGVAEVPAVTAPPAVVAVEPAAEVPVIPAVPPVAEPAEASVIPVVPPVVPDKAAEPPAAGPPVATAKPDKLSEEVEEDLRKLIEGESRKPAAQPQPAAVRPPPVAVEPPVVAGATGPAEEAFSLEQSRREAMAQHARGVLKEGYDALAVSKYEEAINRFEFAVKNLSRPEDIKDRKSAQNGLAEAHYRYSIYLEKQALNRDELRAAFVQATKARDYGHRRGEARMIELRQKIEQPPVAEAEKQPVRWKQEEYVKKQEKMSELLRRGREHMLANEFELARKYFENVLKEDPQNTEAIRLLRKASNGRYDRATAEVDTTREAMMAEVRRTWNPRNYDVVEQKIKAMDVGQIRQQSEWEAVRNKILQKLQLIEIPEINFHQANINDVIAFLQDASREYDKTENDPARKGVNIILNLMAGGGRAAAPAAPAVVDPFADTTGRAAGAPGSGDVQPITFKAQYITLVEALKIVTSVADLKWRIEGKVVMIVPKNAPDGEVVIRMYDVLPSVEEKLQGLADAFVQSGGGGGGLGGGGFTPSATMEAGGTGSRELDWKQAFRGMGISWPETSSIKYVRAMGKLVVANTENNLAEFEKILAVLNVVPYQIEIETRFVEVTRTDINSLGLEWLLTDDWELASAKDDRGLPMAARRRLMIGANSGQGGFTRGNRFLNQEGVASAVADDILTISSVLTNPELSFVIHALEQRGYADLLSAPKITTQAGQEATIKVVTEYIYPTDFEVTPVTGTGTTTGTTTIRGGVVEPSSFETREVGVILSVLPDVSPEGRMINLTMTPEVVSEPEWKDYGSVFTDDDGNETRLRMEQPFFHTRSISTSISIYNGATVVMGGMISENRRDADDKVPFLGDVPLLGKLFRSNHERSEKRNLLIFVTARLVDPAGRPLEQAGANVTDRLAGASVGGDSAGASSTSANP